MVIIFKALGIESDQEITALVWRTFPSLLEVTVSSPQAVVFLRISLCLLCVGTC